MNGGHQTTSQLVEDGDSHLMPPELFARPRIVSFVAGPRCAGNPFV